MFSRYLIGFILALMVGWPGAGAAQSDELMRAFRQYQELEKRGKHKEAVPFARRALELGEKEFGLEDKSTALLLTNLAILYAYQEGHYKEAEPLYKRSLVILEKTLGADHLDVATSLNNLAELYRLQGRYAAAEPLHKRSLVIREKAFGPDHPSVANSINNLALLYVKQGSYAAAEPLYKRSLVILEKTLGADHPDVAASINNLAVLYDNQGRYAAAEPFYKRSLAITVKALGPDHPDVANGLGNLAGSYKDQGQIVLALDYVRRSSAIHRRRAEHTGGRSGGRLSETKSVRGYFVAHVDYATVVAEKEPSKGAALTSETFEVGQLARATSVGAAVAGMGARFGSGSDALAITVRRHQDAINSWQRLDKKLIDAVGQPPDKRSSAAVQKFRAQLVNLDSQIKNLGNQLIRDFPKYAELASPKPLRLADTRKLLGPEEVLMTWLVADKETYLWAVRSNKAQMFQLDIGRAALDSAVKGLHIALDPDRISSPSDIPTFNTARAFKLYQQIFAAAEPMLEGINHIFVVADGALQSLPIGVLVTKQPKGNITNLSGYRQVPWLAKKYAFTTLPSVSSLKALRRLPKTSQASRPFGGFGDPLLSGNAGSTRGLQMANLFSSSGTAKVDLVRLSLPPLPETADELRTMARILGGDNSDLFLGERATERHVRLAALDKYRVLAFATHGLVAGELKGLAEPALVLTPPRVGSVEDDGLLTASEVAMLKLNADLVILSACNTAAADGTPGADALSGLTKAFFYAGARSLLVSHWPVASDAAVKLTTRMLSETSGSNTVGRAEALRRSMLALMQDAKNPHFAHPYFWAPFVLVGEGGSRSQ
ncbi:MAG: CHAT domain-containing protein [Rhodospirillaceae bacterium]|nr:CHAT domain-containing protein [Rhodospirillaceae bacterium]